MKRRGQKVKKRRIADYRRPQISSELLNPRRFDLLEPEGGNIMGQADSNYKIKRKKKVKPLPTEEQDEDILGLGHARAQPPEGQIGSNSPRKIQTYLISLVKFKEYYELPKIIMVSDPTQKQKPRGKLSIWGLQTTQKSLTIYLKNYRNRVSRTSVLLARTLQEDYKNDPYSHYTPNRGYLNSKMPNPQFSVKPTFQLKFHARPLQEFPIKLMGEIYFHQSYTKSDGKRQYTIFSASAPIEEKTATMLRITQKMLYSFNLSGSHRSTPLLAYSDPVGCTTTVLAVFQNIVYLAELRPLLHQILYFNLKSKKIVKRVFIDQLRGKDRILKFLTKISKQSHHRFPYIVHYSSREGIILYRSIFSLRVKFKFDVTESDIYRLPAYKEVHNNKRRGGEEALGAVPSVWESKKTREEILEDLAWYNELYFLGENYVLNLQKEYLVLLKLDKGCLRLHSVMDFPCEFVNSGSKKRKLRQVQVFGSGSVFAFEVYLRNWGLILVNCSEGNKGLLVIKGVSGVDSIAIIKDFEVVLLVDKLSNGVVSVGFERYGIKKFFEEK